MGMWIGTFVSSASDVFVVVVNPLYCRQINTENMVKWCTSTGAVTEQPSQARLLSLHTGESVGSVGTER